MSSAPVSQRSVRQLLVLVLAVVAAAAVASRLAAEKTHGHHHKLVAIPSEDRFSPFAIQIRAGDTVDWVNNDTDDHTVVSNDAVNTAGPKSVDMIIPGTDNNGGKPGTFSITFHEAGMWNYFCRFHSTPNTEFHQPFAPGPDGGIQTTKVPSLCSPPGSDTCNFGTPMMGVIAILPRED